jgi:group I intron endonuclease
MIGIYKITSPSGKVYIGQSVYIERRESAYSNLRDCKNQTKLYNSLAKYGFSEHIFEIIEQCTIEELNTRERYWQDFYNVLGPEGLNCRLTTTADRSGKVSEDSLAKRTASTDFARRTINTDYGKKVINTDYSVVANKNKKPVQQYTKQAILIQEWSSGREAGRTLGISPGSISSCCRGLLKTSGEFIWKYK